MCVLGAINERYEAHCDVCMNIFMCQNLVFNYGQIVGFLFVLFHKTECVCLVLMILNLEEEQNCMISLKVTKILPPFFQKNLKFQT